MDASWEALEWSLLHRCIVDGSACAAVIAKLGGYEWQGPENGWFWEQIVEVYGETGEPPSFAVLAGTARTLPSDLHDPLLTALREVEKAPVEQRPRALAKMLVHRARKRVVALLRKNPAERRRR